MRRQRGFTFLIAIVLLTMMSILAIAKVIKVRTTASGGTDQANARFGQIKTAMIAYVAQMGRLPCPADPTAATGTEVRNGGNSTCGFAQGTVPWASVGLRQDDAMDPWGWKISYRVYTGTAGTLTQPEGVSLVQCDTTQAQGPTSVNFNHEGGLCKNNNKTVPGQYSDVVGTSFLGQKGLIVSDFGTVRSGIAYVLISHGPSGYGGYTANGTQLTAPSNVFEIANTSASGPFIATNATNSATVSPSDATHFDDIIAYAMLDDLIAKAGRSARVWP